MGKDRKFQALGFKVENSKGKIAENAIVSFSGPLGRAEFRMAALEDPSVQTDLPNGEYLLELNVDGFEPIRQKVRVSGNNIQDPVFFVRPDQDRFYIGGIKVPLSVEGKKVGMRLDPANFDGDIEGLRKRLRNSLGVELEVKGKGSLDTQSFFMSVPENIKGGVGRVLKELKKMKGVLGAGPLLTESENGVTFLNGQLLVEFYPEVTWDRIVRYTKEKGLRISGTIPGSGNGYFITADREDPYEILRLADQMIKDGIAEVAEPDMAAPVEYDVLPPTDAMYPEVWHLQVANVPNAWNTLRARPGAPAPYTAGDITYGSENIVLAVLDQGIHTMTPAGGAGAVSANPEFLGTVIGGGPKLYLAASFAPAVPVLNNNVPTGSHGMGCAGVAVGSETNPPMNVAAGDGIVGAAPNVPLIGLMHTGSSQAYANMFTWAAGLPVARPNPAQINPAAAIITNSWGWTAAQLAGGGLAGYTAAFNGIFMNLSTFGRRGRGTLLFFSTGNALPAQAAAVRRPFSIHPRTLGIGASSLTRFPNALANETVTAYSGFGGALGSGQEIDVIAPSHDQYAGLPQVQHAPTTVAASNRLGALSARMHSEGMRTGAGRLATTAVAGAATVAANNWIQVGTVTGFGANMILLIGPAGAPIRAHYITQTSTPPAPNRLTLAQNVGAVHAIGVNLIGLSGNMPGGPGMVSTTLQSLVGAAATQIQVATTAGFVPGQQIYFGGPGAGPFTTGTIQTIESAQYMTLAAAPGAIANGTVVTGLTTVQTTVATLVVLPAAPAGPTDVEVASTAGFVAGQQVLFNLPGAATSEVQTLGAVLPPLAPSPNPRLRFNTRLNTAHAAGVNVQVVGGMVQTTVGAAGAAVGTAVLPVTSTAGFQIGQAIVVGNPVLGGTLLEFNAVASIPNNTTLNLVKNTVKICGAGTTVFGGAPSFTTTFGGTSSATPLSAGISALILSAKPSLTWVEARDILRTTAVKIQPGAAGNWRDVNNFAPGNPNYVADFYSTTHGYGRVNANAAVTAALAYNHNDRDLRVRDTLTDDGVNPGNPGETIINSPDIWVRNTAPGAEAAGAALPAGFPAAGSFAVAGPHQKPVRSNNRWVYVRVSNRGTTQNSLDAWVRLYIAVSHGEPNFNFPDAWFNFGGAAGIQNNAQNLYLLNPNGTSIYGVAAQATPAPGIPALQIAAAGPFPMRTRGILPGANHVTWVQWNQADLPTIPYPFRAIHNWVNIAAADTIIQVQNTMNLVNGQQILFNPPGGASHRVGTIATVDSDTQITLTANVGAAFPLNTPLIPLSTTINTTVIGGHAAGGGALSAVITVNDASIFKIGQYVLLNAPGSATSQIVAVTDFVVNPAGNDSITIAPSNTAALVNTDLVTLVSDPMRTFVVAEVSPHDGELAGNNFYNNSNITYKEVNLLTDISFRNQADTADLSGNVIVPEAGTPVTTNFQVRLDDGENFISENTIIRVTRHHVTTANTETVRYRFNGGAWGFDTAPAAGWLVLAAPLTAAAAAAAGPQPEAHFQGSFTVDPNHNKVSFTVIAGGNYNPPAGPAVPFTNVKHHDVVVFTEPAGTSNLGLTQSNKPRFFIWTDMAQLDAQVAANAYGPVPDPGGLPNNPQNKFNLTSGFTAPAAATVPAYAAVTGTVFIQRDATDNNKVNLFLKPLHQSRLGYTGVKYFIYRGLKLTDFLVGTTAITELQVRPNGAGASAFIQYVYSVYNQLSADRGVVAPALVSKALGWDPPNQGTLTDPVDKYFFAVDPNFQLPIVPKGMRLGDFHNAGGSRFGFEIILEEGSYSPDLANARLSFFELDVSALAGNAQRAKREDILNYIDPAAYYGMHFNMGVETTDAANPIKKGADLFNVALVKFFTRNRIYIDIRNESGYSMNFYSNYTDGAGNQVQIGDEELVLTASPYHTSNWPILIRSTSAPVERDNTPVYLQLRIDDNRKPLVFVEWSELISGSTADKFIAGNDLVNAGVFAWTKTMGLVVPNIVDPGDPNSRIRISQVVKLHYFRQQDAATVWPATVLRTDSYLANLFGPLEAPELFSAPATDIEWVSAQDRRFIDNSGAGGAAAFAYVAERGVAQEDTRVIYWASATDRYDTDISNYAHLPGITGGTSTKGNFFEVGYMFRGLRLNVQVVKDAALPAAAQEIRTLGFVRVDTGDLAAEHLMVLGITEGENTTLQGVLGFSNLHERTLRLVAVAGSPFTDTNGVQYWKYALQVAGLDAAMNYVTVAPGAPIHVYSTQRQFFVSKAFGDAQPDPVYYSASMEERLPDLSPAIVTPIIQAAPNIETLINFFTAQVAGVTNDAQARTLLENLAIANCDDLWTHAVAFAKTNRDDRAYFLARNKMRYELRRHPYFLGKDAERDQVTGILERLTRNYQGSLDFGGAAAGAKKIVVIGLDPDALLYQTVNPSAATALALHGENINSGAINGTIRSTVMPARYSDYDGNLFEGIYNLAIQNNSVDMILVLNYDLADTKFDMERVASRYRGRNFDNENQLAVGQIGADATYAEFYETNVPAAGIVSMVPGPFTGTAGNQWLYFDESAQSTTVTKEHPIHASNPPNGNAASYALNTLTGTAKKGSGGDFFGNELYYRLLYMQNQHGSTVKVAMVTLPDPANVIGGAITMADVVSRVSTLLTNSLPHLI